MTNQTPPPNQNMNWAPPPNQPPRFPHRREIKFVAKRIMMHPVCMRVTLLLVCISVAFYGIRYLAGGTLSYGVMNLADYSSTQSGIFFNDQGFSILFRMDLTQTVLAIPLTYRQIAVFVLINLLCLALLAPLRLGAMEQYWNVIRTGQGNVQAVGQWYRQSGRMGKAIVVEFVIVGTDPGNVKISGITVGKIVDYGLKDSQNMGACMAPAAADTIVRNLKDFGRTAEDYDRIITGDLGYVGQSILFDLMREKEYDIKERHMDCGMTIFDQSRQDTHAGGSGCGCAAATLSAYILPAIASGEWKRVLFVPTGALMSTVSYNEGASVPGIAHGIVLEHC